MTLEEFGFVDSTDDEDGDEADEEESESESVEFDGPDCDDCGVAKTSVTERDPYDVPLCATDYLKREGVK